MPQTLSAERADLLKILTARRQFLRRTVRGLSDDQASARTTASELTLGGIIKHVALTEERWARFITEGAAAMSFDQEAGAAEFQRGFQLTESETLAGVLAMYEQVAARTDELVVTLPDLDNAHALPQAPWFEPGAAWTARHVLLHIATETAQHAGHADIIRESLDGAKTMG